MEPVQYGHLDTTGCINFRHVLSMLECALNTKVSGFSWSVDECLNNTAVFISQVSTLTGSVEHRHLPVVLLLVSEGNELVHE